MQFVFQKIIAHPKGSLFLAGLLLLFLSPGLGKLEIDASTRSLFSPDDEDVQYHREVKENFGSDSFITVVAKSPELFTSETLSTLRQLSGEMENIDGVAGVISLFSINALHSVDGILSIRPVITEIPGKPEALQQLRAEILGEPLVIGLLLNETGDAAAFHIEIAPPKGEEDIERLVTGQIEMLLENFHKSSVANPEVYLVGAPLIKIAATEYILHDLVVLGPVVLLMIGGVIFFFYRSLLTTFLPLLTGIISVLATLGFMGFAGFSINPFTSVIVVLILVMGCTEDLHILAEYSLGLRSNLSREKAISALKRTVLNALCLTSLTTVLGFASIAPNPVTGLRQFAIACAVGIFLNFVFTLLLVPALLRLGPPAESFLKLREPNLQKICDLLTSAIFRKRKLIAIAVLFFSVLAILGASRLQLDTSYLRFFPKHSEVGEVYQKFSRDFGGASTFSVTIETNRKSGIYKESSLQQLTRLHDFLESRYDHVLGVVDILRDIDTVVTNDPETAQSDEPHRLRNSWEKFTSQFGSFLLAPFVDHDQSRTIIRIRSLIRGSKGMREAEQSILQFVSTNLSDEVTVRVTGERVLISRISDRITRQLVVNLFVLWMVVTALLSLFFRSMKIGFLALIPNALPILATFGYMGWAGIPLSTGTFSVAIVAFGIAVDDTIHFLTRFFHESERNTSIAEALQKTFQSEIRPILATSTALILGYLVLLFSPFLVHQETGILFSIAILAALLADLFVTPLLLVTASGLSAISPAGKADAFGNH
ncbi:MAG: MMPL family transporter [Verrucomicrobiales bacterium]|nr:MMPL family transporter [Verrucomicrobiales bacterium]